MKSKLRLKILTAILLMTFRPKSHEQHYLRHVADPQGAGIAVFAEKGLDVVHGKLFQIWVQKSAAS